MLGILRFILAGCVVASHLTGGLIPDIGLLAVNFFYVISGYLITMILNTTYKFKLGKFALNRFLRLYPVYYIFAGIALLLHTFTLNYQSFHGSWSGIFHLGDILGNLLIFPWSILADGIVPVNFTGIAFFDSIQPHYRLIPSTWSVGVEIVCYFLLWLFTARNTRNTIITIVLASIFHICTVVLGLNETWRYFSVPGAMLPFGVGALAYFLAKRKKEKTTKISIQFLTLGLSVCLYILNWYVNIKLGGPMLNSPLYYINILLAFGTVLMFHGFKSYGITKKVSRWLGDLSYPMFLGHYVFGYVGWLLIGKPEYVRGWKIFFVGIVITIIASIITIILVDRPIQKLRDKIRPKPKGLQQNTLTNNNIVA